MSTIHLARPPLAASTSPMTGATLRMSSPVDPSSPPAVEAASVSAVTFPRQQNTSRTSPGGRRTQASHDMNLAADVGTERRVSGTRHSQSGYIAPSNDPTDHILPSHFHTGPCSRLERLSPACRPIYACPGPSHNVQLTSPRTGHSSSTLAGQQYQSHLQFPVLSSPQSHVPQAQDPCSATHTVAASSPVPIPLCPSARVHHIHSPAHTYSALDLPRLQTYHCPHSCRGVCFDTHPRSFPSSSRDCYVRQDILAGAQRCVCHSCMLRDATNGQYGTEHRRQVSEISGRYVDGLPCASSPILCGAHSLPCSYAEPSPLLGVMPAPSPAAMPLSLETPVHLRRSALMEAPQERCGTLEGSTQGVISDSLASTSCAVLRQHICMHACVCGAKEPAREYDYRWSPHAIQQMLNCCSSIGLHPNILQSSPHTTISSTVGRSSQCRHDDYDHHSHQCNHCCRCGAQISSISHVSQDIHSSIGAHPENWGSLPSRSVPPVGDATSALLSPLPLPTLPVPQLAAISPSQTSVSTPAPPPSGFTTSNTATRGSATSRETHAEMSRTSVVPSASATLPTTPPVENACLRTIDETISNAETASTRTGVQARPRAYSHPNHPPSSSRSPTPSSSQWSPPRLRASNRRRALSQHAQKPAISSSLSPASSSTTTTTSTSYGTLTSLTSLGIGLAEAEREERKSKGLFRRRAASVGKGQTQGQALGQVQGQEQAPGDKDKRKVSSIFGIGKDVADAYIGQECVRRAEVSHLGGSKDASGEGGDAGTTGAGGGTGGSDRTGVDVKPTRSVDGEDGGRVGSTQDRLHKSHILRSGEREYERVREHVSLALTSIMSPAALEKISPAGRAIVRAGHTASSVAHSLLPAVKEGLVISSDLLQFAPLPGLEEAAKTLLVVWEACEDVDTNRLACLRLTERCATLLLSVRCEIAEAGDSVADELSIPVGKLCDALHLVLEFLQRQLHRSFLTRYLWRAEIQREISACDKAISDVMSMFGFSIQMRTLKHVLATADESRRFAEEVQHQLESGCQWHEEHGKDVISTTPPAVPPVENALGLSAETPPPTYQSPRGHPTSGNINTNESDTDSESSDDRTPMQSMFPPMMLHIPPAVASKIPVDATGIVGTGGDRVLLPLDALTQLHATQNASDSAADDAALCALLQDVVLTSGNDAEVLRAMQLGRVEIPEIAEALERVPHSPEVEQGNEMENPLDFAYSAITEEHSMHLGPGPCGLLDEELHLSLPPSRHTITTAPLVSASWEREDDARQLSTDIVGRFRGYADHDPCVPFQRPPSFGLLASPRVGVEIISFKQDAYQDSSTDVSPADECYETAAEITPVEKEAAPPSKTQTLKTGSESISDPERGAVPVPDVASCRSVNPLAIEDVPKLCSGASSPTPRTLKSVVKGRGTADNIGDVEDCGSPPPPDECDADVRNERRYRLLARHTHSSLTLPLWSPTHVSLGAVGYLSRPKGQFIVLFNALDPFSTASGTAKNIKSMYAYGKLKIETRSENKRSMAQKGLDVLSSFLLSNLRSSEPYSEKVARRYSFPLNADQNMAYVFAESTVYRYFVNLEAPKDWLKQNIDAITEEYLPHHPIQKEDLCLVVGTLCAPDYALFVSHSHPEGQVHFNVFSNRKAGQPWGRFTTDTKRPSPRVTGSSCDKESPDKALFASKVSTVRGNRVNGESSSLAPVKWNTLMLARLGFKSEVEDPVLL